MTTFRAGTRGSALALKQVDIVTEALAAAHPGIEVERLIIKTEGDRRTEVTLEQLGGQGVFVKDIEARLMAGEIDIAIHSLKDMPAVSPEGLIIGAVLPRADARDALISHRDAGLGQLPQGARIGTDSRRRATQLLEMRPDLRIESVRGNVETRMRKATEGELDGVILAAAGLERLGLLGRASQIFSVEEMLPAVGQAVLAVQCRADDTATLDVLKLIDDAPTRAAITAERAFLATLGAGCRLPVAAYATVDGSSLRLQGFIAGEKGPAGKGALAGSTGDAEEIGNQLARLLAAVAGVEVEAAR